MLQIKNKPGIEPKAGLTYVENQVPTETLDLQAWRSVPEQVKAQFVRFVTTLLAILSCFV